jgi:hypothetical protein
MIDWDDYEPYVPLHWGPLHELSRSDARDSFHHLMDQKPQRLAQLRQLLKANGVEVAADDEGIRALEGWFRQSVEPNPEEPTRLRNLWYAVVNDIALFLGDALIDRCPRLRWEMFTSGKRNISFQRPVIAGFSRIPNPRYCLDLGLAVATYGHQLVQGDEPPTEHFLEIINYHTEQC